MTIAIELAKRVRGFTYQNLPQAAVESAKMGILDTVGVTLAGSVEPCAQIVLRVSHCHRTGPGVRFHAAPVGHRRRAGKRRRRPMRSTSTIATTPSAAILRRLSSGLFALADASGRTGREFITAYVAGFETEMRIAMGVHFYHYTKGWHPTATLGVFGGAAAAAQLMKLPQDKTATHSPLRPRSPPA